MAAARKTLDTMVKREAKDICEKYLSVPATTNFGIMFVPFEGLYAEVVSRPGLIETLGRDYHVNVAPQHHGGHSQQPADELPNV